MKTRKLITELYQYEKILAAIKDRDLQSLIHYICSPEKLGYVDAKGKSLLQIIQDASFDINKSIPYEYNDDLTIHQTPLQYHMSAPGFSLEMLKVLQRLGANFNHIIDSKGNSVLHRYVKGNDIEAPVLQILFSAGGDFLMKNKENKTPIDLASREIAIYIKKMLDTQPKEHITAIMLQRKWRLHSAKKKYLDEKPADTVTLSHPLLNRIAETPKENPPDEKKMQQWINAHDDKHKETAKKVVAAVQYIPHGHFLFGLKMATKKFNEYLLSLPKTNRNYILAVDYRDDKSSWWVTKLAEKYLIFPPKKIITTNEIRDFKPSDDTCHMVLFDDLSYSGNFYTGFLSAWNNVSRSNKTLFNVQFHLVIPFVSEEAQARLKEFNVVLHSQERVPNFNVPGTLFSAKTATYPAHKNPDTTCSTIKAIEEGISVDGKETGIAFAEKVIPPYKVPLSSH